jgi:hypothetical protein
MDLPRNCWRIRCPTLLLKEKRPVVLPFGKPTRNQPNSDFDVGHLRVHQSADLIVADYRFAGGALGTDAVARLRAELDKQIRRY